MLGKRFERLTVIAICGERKGRLRCRCDCGAVIERDRRRIVSGHTRSCGCLKRDELSARLRSHGESGWGGKATKLFQVWCGMRQRTTNPNAPMWQYYGAKGVSVCAEWLDYAAFRDWSLANGYREGLTIDRIDGDGDYGPQNCRWVTVAAQNRNTSRNLIYTHRGTTACLKDHAAALGLSYDAVRLRITKLGWSPEKALETPIKQYHRKTAVEI